MPFVTHLYCEVDKKKYDAISWLDDTCGFRLRIIYDLEARNDQLNIRDFKDNSTIAHWKYWKFFPIESKNSIISVGEGGTPLVKSSRMAAELGLTNLYFKLESSNPSGSFKDRPISVGVSVAKEMGFKVLSAASSGNAAAALSMYCARSGLDAVVFVPERASRSKVSQLVTLGATVIRTQDGPPELGDPSVYLFKRAIENFGWSPVPSFGPFNPFQFEGTKSLAYEIVEQLNWEVPDWILCNTGSGGLLSGTAEGFFDWFDLDWITQLPKFVAVQPENCDPIVKSFNKNVDPYEFEDLSGFPETVAGGLADPHPFDGDGALQALYRSKGTGRSVSDSSILAGQGNLANLEGIFGSPTGVASIPALYSMVNDGTIDRSDVVVIPITDHGLKDIQVISSNFDKAILSSPNIKILQKKLKEHNIAV